MDTQPTKHMHADLILEFARQLSTGEIDEGWWKWEYSHNDRKTWIVLPEPSFVAMFEYRYTPTEKNPAFKPKLKLIAMHKLPLGTMVSTRYLGEAQLMAVSGYPLCWVWRGSGKTETVPDSDLRITENKEFTFYDCKTGKCPVPDGLRVQIMTRDSEVCTKSVSSFVWTYLDDKDKEIIAYRIVGVADGYTDNPELAK